MWFSLKLDKHVKSEDYKATFIQKVCFDFFFLWGWVSICFGDRALRFYFMICEKKDKGTGKEDETEARREVMGIQVW